MQLVFRHVSDQEFTQPPAGELILRLRLHTGAPVRAMAEHVLREGLAPFPQGATPIDRVVAPFEPTLDDMLAAEMAMHLAAGEKLPDGIKLFARYAALVREGLKPGEVPLDCSLEGIFLAMRSDAGTDLSKPEAGARLAHNWSRLANRIWAAANAGIDPFTQTFLGEGSEFARERTFLRRDHEVFHQDVERGQQWSMHIPAGPPSSFGLLLHQPKSLLFKYWSRDPESGREGKPYTFLAVDGGAKQWVFSTDPVQRLSLLGLHEKLQAAETAANAQRAAGDSWFDGAPFGNTLVASPKQGTLLPDDHVLRIVKQWTGAKPLGKYVPESQRGIEYWSKWAGLISATVAVVTLVISLSRQDHASVPTPGPGPVVKKAPEKISEKVTPVAATQGDLLRGVVEKQGDKLNPGKQQSIDLLSYNPTRVEQHVKLHLALHAKDPQETPNLKVQSFYVNGEDRPRYANFELRDGLWQTKEEDKQDQGDKDELAALFQKGQNKVTVVATTDGKKPVELQSKLEWQVDSSYLPDLHLLAIGVGDSLPHSVDDAQALYDFFERKDTGLLFRNVHRIEPILTNEQANKESIFDAINQLNKSAKVGDLVLISVSAHGTVVGGRYYLLPSGWSESEQTVAKLNSSAISQDDFLSSLKELAEKCYVLVVLDTCHAAAIAVGGTTRDVEGAVDMNQFIDTKRLTDRMQRNPKGIVIISACLGNEQANELNDLKHGALTFALLEGLEGKLLHPDPKTDDSKNYLPHGRVVDLAQITFYVQERVKRLTDQLTNHQQSVVITDLQGISLGDIPILVRPAVVGSETK